jgi:MFS family permease
MNAYRRVHPSKALHFIILLGIVSLLADMTYEGARSITGPYLATLGANAAIIGLVAGFGEFAGYGLRLVSGYWADKTRRHLTFTSVGYVINLCAVPLLAFTSHWETAACLIVIERLGKAIRVPAKDAMLSFAGQDVGMGWAFGLHRFLDQIGAVLGPLFVSLMVYITSGYRVPFGLLALPALLALMTLTITNRFYKRLPIQKPYELELKLEVEKASFWYFLIGCSFIAMGYVHFALISYHFKLAIFLRPFEIPIAYALAMGFEGLAAPICGWLYDKRGISVMIVTTLLVTTFSPLVFFGGTTLSFIGIAIWGIGMGANGALMKAVIGDIVPSDKRAFTYGIFNVVYGFFWFLGSLCIGLIYERSIVFTVIFMVTLQLLALPWLFAVKKTLKTSSVNH